MGGSLVPFPVCPVLARVGAFQAGATIAGRRTAVFPPTCSGFPLSAPSLKAIAKDRAVVQSHEASVRRISMPLDVLSLQSFYASPLGRVTHRLIGRVIRERWDRGAGLCFAAVGYGAPYLERFRDSARRCLAFMPAEQGVVIWPEAGRCAAALVDAQMLPLRDGSIDRLL